MSASSTVIIWCDAGFGTGVAYHSAHDQINEITTAREVDPHNSDISTECQELLRSNNVSLIIVQTANEVDIQIHAHPNERLLVVCSDTVGRDLARSVSPQYLVDHNIVFYVLDHLLSVDWAEPCEKSVKMFDFPIDLLLRLRRDISKQVIEQGKTLLSNRHFNDALTCFRHAERLENLANERQRTADFRHDSTTYGARPDFRDHLDMLQGANGLIAQAETALRNREEFTETSATAFFALTPLLDQLSFRQ